MQTRKPPKWAIAAIIIITISTAMGSLIALTILLNSLFGVRELIDTEVDQVPDILATLDVTAGIPTAVTPSTPTLDETLVPPISGSYSLILAGNDYRPGREPACDDCLLIHTDAFVYVNIVFGQSPRVTMISIPRELYLHVDGIYPDSRVNQLYARGGIDWIELWAETILGVEIDGIMIVQMDKFETIIDELGGIDILAHETFRDKCGDEFYQYEEHTLYHMNGFTTLCYARMRQYHPRGYFARQERHMDILKAIFDEVIEEFREDPLVTSVKMVSLYYESTETNMSPEFIAKIISEGVINYISPLTGLDIFHFSIDTDNLELYPRANDDSPYLYKPTFVISDWVHCVLSSSWPFDCEYKSDEIE